MAGSQFDPQIVDAIVQLWHRGVLADYCMRLGASERAADILDVPTSLSAPAARPVGRGAVTAETLAAPQQSVRVAEPELSGSPL